MSVFSPAARVTDPEGREWEIYAYRLQLPPRGELDPGSDDGTFLSGRGIAPIPNPFDGILWMFGKFLVTLTRVFWDFPRAALAARRSDEWTIEAVTEIPHRTTYTWKTTGEYRGHVLAQVEAGIAYGEIPRPRYSTFVGVEG